MLWTKAAPQRKFLPCRAWAWCKALNQIKRHRSSKIPRRCVSLRKDSIVKRKKLYNLAKDIKKIDGLCISHEEKKERIKELEQLRESIIYSMSHLHFFWQHETMISHVRKQVYDLWDMIGNENNLLLLLVNYLSFLFQNCSWLWWILWSCNWIVINFNCRTCLLDIY